MNNCDDLLSANIVELTIDSTGKLWLNVDGKCAARIGKVNNVLLELPGKEPKQIYKEHTNG
jgi:hypothetical protein